MDAASAGRLFDANASTYDRVNGVISLGLANRWYRWASSRALDAEGSAILDAFAGTGRVGLDAAARGAKVTLADASEGMLEVAKARARARGLQVATVSADLSSETLTIPGAPFDAITVMWGLRYVDDPAAVLRGLAGLLRPGGRVVVVEFVEPERPGLSAAYFFRALPRIAGALAGRPELYRELVESTHRMGPPQRLIDSVESAGLRILERKAMGFGLVLGVVAKRQT